MRLKLSDIFLNEGFMPLRSLSALREEDSQPDYGDEDTETSAAGDSNYESVEEPEDLEEADCSENQKGEEKLSEEDEKMLESWRRISGIQLNS